MMDIRWKVITQFPNYAVSDSGRVKRLTSRTNAKSGAVLSQFLVDGYPSVNLLADGKRKSVRVHRLVAAAFVDRGEGTTEVNHIDAVRVHNDFTNLEWVTGSGNRFHAYRVGSLRAAGQDNGYSKLTDGDVMQIRGSDETESALAARLIVSTATIRDVRARRTWTHL